MMNTIERLGKDASPVLLFAKVCDKIEANALEESCRTSVNENAAIDCESGSQSATKAVQLLRQLRSNCK